MELTDTLERLLGKQFELDAPALDLDTLRTAAQKLKYNLLMRPVEDEHSDDSYRQRLRIESTLTLSQLTSLVNAWRESNALDTSPERVLDELAPEVNEEKLLEVYGAHTTFGYLTPALRKRRLEEAAGQLAEHPSRAREAVAPLRDEDSPTVEAAEAIWHMASFYRLLRGVRSLDFGAPEAFVEAYTEELYACDTHYRKAVAAVRALRERSPSRESLLRPAYETFLRDYHESFVHPLNTAWQRALERSVQEGEGSPSLQRQGSFYTEHLEANDQKTAVIVSDALRLEVAKELADGVAQSDARKLPTLHALLASLPTVTSVGMAHLLPHEDIEWADGSFNIDGRSTSGTANREHILQSAAPDARAVQLNDLREYGEREGRALFKEHPLVYIYRNRIDAVDDDRKTEQDTVPAVEKAVDELRSFVRTLNNWNVYRVLITADHGFLYTETDVPDSMQESFPEAEGGVLRRNRCLVAEESPSAPGYRFCLGAVSDIASDLTVHVPRAVNRYRLRGAGKRFAHGGASLQEMLVPALEVRKVREDRAERVGVRLVSDKRVIRSGALSVKVVQTEAVSSSRQARTVQVGLYDDQGQLVSDEHTLTLDETSTDPTARMQKVLLTLGPEANDLNFCRLQVHDQSDHNRLDPLADQRYSIQRLIEQDDF